MAIKKGDKVKVEYTGNLDDGTQFDSNLGKEPLCFDAGSGAVITGFDNALIGMKKGDTKEIKIKPEEGYGMHNPKLVLKVPKANFSEGMELKKGQTIMLKADKGPAFQATISGMEGEHVMLDLNHPLAGKNLNFTIRILDC